ncbi:hypothetical protein [Streptomyces melanogenes]|uniref:hypothetical protein n=1 Tax=Streptomyces melanogenes TaxID=67326 RepID=UPI0037A8CF5E
MPGCRYSVGHGPDGEFALWLADHHTTSWAGIDYAPGATAFDVVQYGPRHLWDEAEAALRWWEEAGAPVRTRFGLTITASDQWMWLDDPDRPATKPTMVQ